MDQDYLNLWMSDKRVPDRANILSISVSGEIDKDSGKRWKVVVGTVSRLCRRGFVATHIPIALRQKFLGDIAVLSPGQINDSEVMKSLPKIEGATMKPSLSSVVSFAEFQWLFESAWRDWSREVMRKAGFLHQGLGTYVATGDLVLPSTHKPAFRISPDLVSGHLALWIDPETRIMNPLKYEEGRKATEDEPIPVRVLMDWRSAFVVGAYNENVSQYKEYNLEEYWRDRGIPVTPANQIFKVKFGDQITTYAYPDVCVFKEYQYGKDFAGRKYKPGERVELVRRLLAEKLFRIDFLGNVFAFSPEPVSAGTLQYEKAEFEAGRGFQIILKRSASMFSTSIFDVKKSLENGAEPYTGKQSGHYVAICPEELEQKITPALKAIEQTYQSLNLGSINQLLPTTFVKGNNRSDYQESFNLTIQELLSKRQDTRHIIAFVVLPEVSWASSIYYEAKRTFFNPSAIAEDVKPIQIQCLESGTVDKIVVNKRYIIENIVPQVYLKLYGRHAALWLCKVPADIHVYPENPGVTAYACFDVSRRKKLKSQVSVFTAVTDGYGRFISFDSIPSGGEKLTELSFYNLIERIAWMCKAYAVQFNKIEPNLKFDLQRIVLYKDGHIEPKERELMEKVFKNGLLDEGREPIPDFFAKRRDLPQNLSIDIISVNKSANRRVFSRLNGNWKNPRRGSFYGQSRHSGLLISSQAQKIDNIETMTVKPLQLELVHHFSINSSMAAPAIKALAEEYYHLTFLDWVSFFQKSKFALPQRITQKTGEFLSYQVDVPKEVVVL